MWGHIKMHLPGRIVYVDNDLELRQKLRRCVESSEIGKSVVLATCSGGKELLDRLRELQPDLILLDSRMPEFSGPEVLLALRKRDSGEDIPVILVCSKAKLVMNEQYKALGVIDILHKPFDEETLVSDIAKIWEENFGENSGIDGHVLSELDGADGDDVDTFSDISEGSLS